MLVPSCGATKKLNGYMELSTTASFLLIMVMHILFVRDEAGNLGLQETYECTGISCAIHTGAHKMYSNVVS